MAKGMGVAKPIRPSPWRRTLLIMWRRAWPPSLEATYFRPQPLAPYLIDNVAKGVGMAKGYRG
uniref:Uncharacterized protein n=1 Tax=Oryza punctata TaxID=4537 RepID=A0A0E0LZI5_ORYPU